MNAGKGVVEASIVKVGRYVIVFDRFSRVTDVVGVSDGLLDRRRNDVFFRVM